MRRRPEPRIVDPITHPRKTVGLRVAAEYLDMDERTLCARIERGLLPAVHDGRVWSIKLSDVVHYDEWRRQRAS
jgi:hypothetical protein